MKLFNNLPLYEALITDENCGVYKVSCVTDPATEVNWVAFDENKPLVKFAVDNKIDYAVVAPDDPLVLGCVDALNLDGGGSSTMYFNGKVLNASKNNERAVVDFLYFK